MGIIRLSFFVAIRIVGKPTLKVYPSREFDKLLIYESANVRKIIKNAIKKKRIFQAKDFFLPFSQNILFVQNFLVLLHRLSTKRQINQPMERCSSG